jgi:predicted SAM-dependent methyltransferase
MDIFASSFEANSIGNKFRKKRFQYFLEKIKNLKKPITILDIGGVESYWINNRFHDNDNYKITLVNIKELETISTNISSEVGDATNLSMYNENQFDIVFSNSVIEHLYDERKQLLMANEVLRIGKFHFVQTPNKYFPIEAHFLLPFFQFLPSHFQYQILTKTKLSRGRKWDNEFASNYLKEIRLLSLNEFQKMFPESEIWSEKFLGLNKSFTAHNFIF